jgi:hypothetical protein
MSIGPDVELPVRILTSGKWELHIPIFWETDRVVTMRSFSAPALYHTEDEVTVNASLMGMFQEKRWANSLLPFGRS